MLRSIGLAGLALDGTGLCSYRVKGVDAELSMGPHRVTQPNPTQEAD